MRNKIFVTPSKKKYEILTIFCEKFNIYKKWVFGNWSHSS